MAGTVHSITKVLSTIFEIFGCIMCVCFFALQLPEKSCFELVKYYYTWKKLLSKVDDEVSLQQTAVGEVRCVFWLFCRGWRHG